MRPVVGGALAFLLFALAPVPVVIVADAGSCARLSSLQLQGATITLAEEHGAGAFTPPGADARATRSLPAFCRVAATLAPTGDSEIKIEIWMPASGWNGKYNAVGNGAFSGAIAYPALSTALLRGYAASSTDTGHTGNTGSFAPGHPEKVIDFGWRAVHEMALAAKRVVASYYGAAPARSYWTGCSAGGRQAMKEAQRFPADFDGIVAGAPGLDWTGRASQAVRVAKALDRADARLSEEQARLVHRAALDACDAGDGVKDGLIGNPEGCRFDPGALQCSGGEQDAACLTPAQVATVRLIYSPIVNPNTKREIAGLAPGSELGWTDRGWTSSARATGLDHFRYLVFNDPAWTPARFAGAADAARAEEADRGAVNALDANLKPFFDRGGKLIHYHGWSDPQISPGNSTQYYSRVVDAAGDAEAVRRSYRLFMAPGMAHCGGGEGPNTFDMMGALEEWVEHGRAPAQIVAWHSSEGRVDRTRPLCPYPQMATYKGSGSIDQAASFVCK
jgi:feruloyl esterase